MTALKRDTSSWSSVERRAYPMSITAMIRLYRLSYLHRALKRTGLPGRLTKGHHEGFNIGPTARQVFRSAFVLRDDVVSLGPMAVSNVVPVSSSPSNAKVDQWLVVAIPVSVREPVNHRDGGRSSHDAFSPAICIQ